MSRGGTREFDRGERVGSELLRALIPILRGVKDPRLGAITLQEVRANRDLSHAKVFFTCFPLDEHGAEQERLLNRVLVGYLRAQLAKTLRLRTVPQLHFVHDASVREGERLAALIDRAVASANTDTSTPDASPPNASPPNASPKAGPGNADSDNSH